MFHPALTTCASERMKTERFSYVAGFAARERMREAKPVKARKSGVPPLFRHSESLSMKDFSLYPAVEKAPSHKRLPDDGWRQNAVHCSLFGQRFHPLLRISTARRCLRRAISRVLRGTSFQGTAAEKQAPLPARTILRALFQRGSHCGLCSQNSGARASVAPSLPRTLTQPCQVWRLPQQKRYKR